VGTIQIGQEDPILSDLEQALITDGSHALQAALATALPWTGLPVISILVGFICDWVSNFIVTHLDQAGYAAYVAINTGKQVSAYYQAKQSGNETTIDKTGDTLVNLGSE